MSIYPCKSQTNVFWQCRAVLLVTLLICALSVQAHAAMQIEDHYFGATLFVVQTGNTVVPPVGVHSVAEYESTYGRSSGTGVDHGYESARLFFSNGGQTLYVVDPLGTTTQAFANALTASVSLPVDLVAIPGAACCSGSVMNHKAIMSALSHHVDASPNRFGLMDAPLDSDANALLAYRTGFTSEHSALYAPWLLLDDPPSSSTVVVPSSSAAAGVISRLDRDEGIHKAPAGPSASLLIPPVLALEREFNAFDHDSLNAANINLLRTFVSPLRILVWGARTTSEVPTRRYIHVSRLLRHLQFSMSRSLLAIYGSPPNAPNPAIVRLLLEDYLLDYWQQGALLGSTSSDAYFVGCSVEPSVLRCMVGVSPLRPAEFEVFQLAVPYGDVIFASGFEANEATRTWTRAASTKGSKGS